MKENSPKSCCCCCWCWWCLELRWPLEPPPTPFCEAEERDEDQLCEDDWSKSLSPACLDCVINIRSLVYSAAAVLLPFSVVASSSPSSEGALLLEECWRSFLLLLLLLPLAERTAAAAGTVFDCCCKSSSPAPPTTALLTASRAILFCTSSSETSDKRDGDDADEESKGSRAMLLPPLKGAPLDRWRGCCCCISSDLPSALPPRTVCSCFSRRSFSRQTSSWSRIRRFRCRLSCTFSTLNGALAD